MQMSQEDLNSKLMQRAEFVAQREELDQLYESTKSSYGHDFELYLKLNTQHVMTPRDNHRDSPETDDWDPMLVASVTEEYQRYKTASFYMDIIYQLK
jgi:hypothetical protein